MSKHSRSTRKRQQLGGIAVSQKWLPLIGIAGLLILIGGAWIITSRSAAPADPLVTGAPAIEVKQTHFDLGDVRFNQMARVTYRIKNVGDQPLEILEYPSVKVLEGC